MPVIGGYWLSPLRIASATASTGAGSQGKSGKPWPRLTAPFSVANADMTVKMVVPTSGRREVSLEKSMLAAVWLGIVMQGLKLGGLVIIPDRAPLILTGRGLFLQPRLRRQDAEHACLDRATGQLEQRLVLAAHGCCPLVP